MDFIYGGCRGNNNNFATKKKCRLICKSRLHDNMATPPPRVPATATAATDKASTGTPSLPYVATVCRVQCPLSMSTVCSNDDEDATQHPFKAFSTSLH